MIRSLCLDESTKEAKMCKNELYATAFTGLGPFAVGRKEGVQGEWRVKVNNLRSRESNAIVYLSKRGFLRDF